MTHVLPGKSLAMSHHRFPFSRWASNMMRSSSGLHFSFLILGSRWLNQRSRHCLPIRPRRWLAITDQRTPPTPCFMTMLKTTSSSSFVHGPLTSPGLSTLFQRCKHCTLLRLEPKCTDIRFHSLAPNLATAARNASSSSGVHRPGPDPCLLTGANGSVPGH